MDLHRKYKVGVAVCALLLLYIICFEYGVSVFIRNLRYHTNGLLNMLIYRKMVLPNFDYECDIPKRWNPVFFYSHNYSTRPEYNIYSKSLMETYCSKHSYEFLDINHGNANISPYWLRVKDLLDMSNQYDDNAVFIYMDLDTCINPQMMDTSVDQMLAYMDYEHEWKWYIGKDTNIKRYINSGVMIIKNSDWTRNMLSEWWGKYNPDAWNNTNGKWACVGGNNKKCEWAGDNYEQGELENLYRGNINDAQTHIAITHPLVLSLDFYTEDKRVYIYHLMGSSNDDRLKIFRSIYEQYMELGN